MDVTTERQDGVLSAQVGGRIDGSNAAEFEEAIRTAIEEPAFLRAPHGAEHQWRKDPPRQLSVCSGS